MPSRNHPAFCGAALTNENHASTSGVVRSFGAVRASTLQVVSARKATYTLEPGAVFLISANAACRSAILLGGRRRTCTENPGRCRHQSASRSAAAGRLALDDTEEPSAL